MNHAIYWLNVGDNALIRQYEARYNCDKQQVTLRRLLAPSLATLEGGAADRHWSDCCRVWGELTGGKYERFYDGVKYSTVEGELDDLRNEGHASRIAMALAGLPVYTKESGE